MHAIHEKVFRKILADARFSGMRHSVVAGTTLFGEGERADALFVHISGVVEIHRGGKAVGIIDHPGTVFGETSMAENGRRTATLTAREDSLMLRIPRGSIADLLHDYPQVSEAVSFLLAERLEESATGVFTSTDLGLESADALLFTDASGQVLSMNRTAAALLGVTPEQGTGRKLSELFTKPDAAERVLLACSDRGTCMISVHPAGRPGSVLCLTLTSQREASQGTAGFLAALRPHGHKVHDAPGASRRRFLVPLAVLLLASAVAMPLFLRPTRTADDPRDLLRSRLKADHAALSEHFAPLLGSLEDGRASSWLEKYALDQGTPALYTRAILIGPAREVRVAYSLNPFSRLRELEGSTYADLEIVPPDKVNFQIVRLYRVDRANPMGRRETEVLFSLDDGETKVGRLQLLALQIDTGTLRSAYGLGAEDLGSFELGLN
jgi:PAS domain S-box-containing protein